MECLSKMKYLRPFSTLLGQTSPEYHHLLVLLPLQHRLVHCVELVLVLPRPVRHDLLTGLDIVLKSCRLSIQLIFGHLVQLFCSSFVGVAMFEQLRDLYFQLVPKP